MKGNPEDRAVLFGQYIVEHEETVRGTAAKFGISKSTVLKDVSERLRRCNLSLYREVQKVLDHNKAERHIRGGLATKEKYRREKSEKKGR